MCGIAFMVGIVLTQFFSVQISWFYLGLFIPLFILFYKEKGIIIVLILFCITFGYVRFMYSIPVVNENNISYYNNPSKMEWADMKDIQWQGIVVSEPDRRIDHTKLTVEAEKVYESIDISGLVLIKSSLYPEYSLGDRLDVNCKLVTPDKIEAFAYDDYLSRYNIYSLCYSPQIELVEVTDKFFIRKNILEFKDRVHNIIQSNIVEPESSVLSAMLLARKRSIPVDIVDNFSRAGVSHLLAISGMHVAIISMLIVKFLSSFYLPKKITYSGTLILLFLYILMIGFPASAIRAGMMGSVVLLADYFGRVNKSYFALLLVAVCTLLFNPKLIVFDLGWQLSFLAVLSLILFSGDMEKLFIKLPKLFGIKAILQTTFAAQILTLPWLMYKFSQMSLIFPIANILLLPVLPCLMCLAIISICLSFFIPNLTSPLFWIIYGLLNKQIDIVNYLGSLSLAAISVPNISFMVIVFIYTSIFFIKFRLSYVKKQ